MEQRKNVLSGRTGVGPSPPLPSRLGDLEQITLLTCKMILTPWGVFEDFT